MLPTQLVNSLHIGPAQQRSSIQKLLQVYECSSTARQPISRRCICSVSQSAENYTSESQLSMAECQPSTSYHQKVKVVRENRVQHLSAHPPAGSSEALPNAVSFCVMGAGIFTAIPFLLMILRPRAVQVRLLMRSFWTFAPLALAYVGLLAYSYTPDMLSLLLPGSLEAGLSGFNPQFFPQLSGIQQLFKGPATVASIILHILSINLFLGRGIYFEGLSSETPTRHSLLATFLLGPTGLLVHWLTKAIYSAYPQLQQPRTVVIECNGGTITLFPYDQH